MSEIEFKAQLSSFSPVKASLPETGNDSCTECVTQRAEVQRLLKLVDVKQRIIADFEDVLEPEKFEYYKKAPEARQNNLMDLVELIIISTILIFLIARNAEAEKISVVEVMICLYLVWEICRKIPKFFGRRKSKL